MDKQLLDKRKKRFFKVSTVYFSNFDNVLENDYNQSLSEDMKKEIMDHLKALDKHFERYFDNQPPLSTWV